MARKHKKKGIVKQGVNTHVIKAAVTSNERVVTEVMPDTPNAITIEQPDGMLKFFLVTLKVVTPAIVKHVPFGPTTKRGKKNHTHKGGINAGSK